MSARIELVKESRKRPRFVLLLSDLTRRRSAIGRLEATIGYDLVEYTPEELAALRLAGYRLNRSNHQGRSWHRLAGVLCAMRKREAREARRQRLRETLPRDEQRAAAQAPPSPAGQMPPAASAEQHPRDAVHREKHPKTGRHTNKEKTHGHRRKTHGHRH